MHEAFAYVRARNKDHIARALASRFSALAVWLPRARGRWRPEAYRMAIFDAAALAITYFESRKAKPRAKEQSRPPAITSQHSLPSWSKKEESPTTLPQR